MQVVFKGLSALGEGPLDEALQGLRIDGRQVRRGRRKRARSRADGPSAAARRRPGEDGAGCRRSAQAPYVTDRIPYSLDPGRRSHAPRDLLLQHDVRVAHAVAQVEEAPQQRARDVVRQVADEPGAASRVERARARSTSSASPFDDREVRGRALAQACGERRGPARPRSRARARAASGKVSAPAPGPISRNVSPGRGSTTRSSRSTDGARRKCWPKRRPMRAQSMRDRRGASRGRASLRAVTAPAHRVRRVRGRAVHEDGRPRGRRRGAAQGARPARPPGHHLPAALRAHRVSGRAPLRAPSTYRSTRRRAARASTAAQLGPNVEIVFVEHPPFFDRPAALRRGQPRLPGQPAALRVLLSREPRVLPQPRRAAGRVPRARLAGGARARLPEVLLLGRPDAAPHRRPSSPSTTSRTRGTSRRTPGRSWACPGTSRPATRSSSTAASAT